MSRRLGNEWNALTKEEKEVMLAMMVEKQAVQADGV